MGNYVIDIVSSETGEIFAENLCGLGSARRWLASRGLTEDYFETDEEFAKSEQSRQECIAEWESKRETHPQHLAEIEANIRRMKEAPPTRYLYVKNDWCPTVRFPTEWIPDYFDPFNGTLVWAAHWGGDHVSTTAFAE